MSHGRLWHICNNKGDRGALERRAGSTDGGLGVLRDYVSGRYRTRTCDLRYVRPAL